MTVAETLKAAETKEALEAVLIGFPKVHNMVTAYTLLTGQEYTGRTRGVSRTDLARNIADEILRVREIERFKGLSVEEKYEELKAQDDRKKKLHACTVDELEALAENGGVDASLYVNKPEREKIEILEKSIEDKMDIARLERMISEEAGTSEMYSLVSKMSREALTEVALSARIIAKGEYHSAWALSDKVMDYYRREIATRTFSAVKEAVSAEEAREILRKADSHTLSEVGKKAGSDFSERVAEKREETPEPANLIEWAIEWILEKLGVTEIANEAETEMATETEEETHAESEAEAPAETEAEETETAEEESHPETEVEAGTQSEPEEAPAEMEEETQSESEETQSDIAFPLEGHTAESLKNIVNTLYSRGSLMSKATGGNFRVSEKLVEELKEYGTTVEEVLRIIRSAGEEWLHGLVFEEDKIVFTGFPATDDAVKSHAYILLATAINNASKEQKRIQAKKVDESNEKFAFRVWLVRLGLNGSETKAERKTFYVNLTGHTAFRTKEDEEKWYARRRAVASTSNAQAE